MSSEQTWQDLRSVLLQQACIAVSSKVQDGAGLVRAIKSVAKEFDNTELGAGHRLKLSPKTLQRIWYRWQRHDQMQSAFALGYAHNGHRSRVDPLLLRLLIERTLQTGAPLSEAVENLKQSGVKISLVEILSAFPKGDLRRFERSHRRLTEQRLKFEKNFIAEGAKWRRALLKQRTETLRKILKLDATLERRLLRHRDQLQRNFLRADARAVRQRELLQRRLLSRIEVTK